MMMKNQDDFIEKYRDDIAIIAMGGRFPGANTIEQFWCNLSQGVDSITRFSRDELIRQGVDESLIDNPNFVSVEGIIDDVELFDAEFFTVSPREAELLDPQHKLFLEVVWEVLEKAGYCTEQYPGVIGVFGGAGCSSYLTRNLLTRPQFVRETGSFKTSLATGQDFVTTRVSYKMGFTGPSINVNTLCSSSSVAVHLARESLLNYQCDIAISGCACVTSTREDSLFYQEGGIGAGDGQCRAFDANASGTVAGNGLAIIALKRMENVLADGDQVLAIIKGTAVNNDGADKASYTAPSADGQAKAIMEALEVADVNPESISYIEAHGTGTNIGDPIEIAGLTKAFRYKTDKKQYCGIGSVKTNIGHLVHAGGVASLIKTVLALQHQQIPASIHFEKPNPKIDFANSPFYVNDELCEWIPTGGDIRRAGVSSFGIGGTNTHIIVEEAPPLPDSDSGREWHTIILSAKTAGALANKKQQLLAYLEKHPDLKLADIAYTLQLGRCAFEYKYTVSCNSYETLLQKLHGGVTEDYYSLQQKPQPRSITFMFPGQGSQYVNMGQKLYQQEPFYRDLVDLACDFLHKQFDMNMRSIMFVKSKINSDTEALLQQTCHAQLALFIVEYALARLWMSWGIKPSSMIGHSIGEYVAACIAGVFSYEDALQIIAKRAMLMEKMPDGKMISVSIQEHALKPYLEQGLWHAVQNGENIQVISGSTEAIDKLIPKLEKDQYTVRPLHTSHGFHSGLMDGMLNDFKNILLNIEFKQPSIPFISNLTGKWADKSLVCSAQYWVDHLRQTVRFGEGIKALLEEDNEQVFIEVGPGHALSTLVRNQSQYLHLIINTLPHPIHREHDLKATANCLGRLWLTGIPINWENYYIDQQRKRVELPTYPFEKKRYWIEPAKSNSQSAKADQILKSEQDCDEVTLDLLSNVRMVFDIPVIKSDVKSAINKKQLKKLLELQNDVSKQILTIVGIKSAESYIANLEINLLRNSVQNEADISILRNKNMLIQNDRPNISTPYIEATNNIEKILVQDWQQVLGYSPVGIQDDFFEVGGHSLMAASLITCIRKHFDLELNLNELLDTSTICKTAELIENKLWLKDSLETGRDNDKQQELETLEL